jgi:hypothetical protein
VTERPLDDRGFQFATMLKALKPGEQGWMAHEFFDYTGKGSNRV